jgi:hypothetical protein
MRGRSSYSGIGKGVVACLAILGGAGLGGLAAGLNARLALPPAPSAAVLAAVAEMPPSETVNLRFPADWSDAPVEAPHRLLMAAAAADSAVESEPRRMALASADSTMVLLSPRPTYPVVGEAPIEAEPAKPKPAPQQAAVPAPKPKTPRSNAVLNDAQIASIKRRLNLTPDQERYWPYVEAELRKMEYAKKGGAAGTRTASVDTSKINVEGLKSAGYPLVMSFSDDQRRELRSLVHLLGLESVMSGL